MYIIDICQRFLLLTSCYPFVSLSFAFFNFRLETFFHTHFRYPILPVRLSLYVSFSLCLYVSLSVCVYRSLSLSVYSLVFSNILFNFFYHIFFFFASSPTFLILILITLGRYRIVV